MNWIRSFEASARHGNITHAARELGLTQAAVSYHVKALESRLDIQLFERGARGVALTGAGSELYLSVAEGIAKIETAIGKFEDASDSKLFVNCNTSLAVNWLTARLPEFLLQNSTLDFRLSTALWQTDAIGVKADLSIFLTSERQIGSTVIPGGDFVVVESAKPIGDIAALITVSGFETTFGVLRQALKNKGDAPRIVECNTFHTAINLARAGVGCTIAPRLLVASGVYNGELSLVKPCDFHPKTHYCLQVSDEDSIGNRAFADWIVDRALKWLRASNLE